MKRLRTLIPIVFLIVGCSQNIDNVVEKNYNFVLPPKAQLLKKDKFLINFCNNKLNQFSNFQAPLLHTYISENNKIFLALCTGADSSGITKSLNEKYTFRNANNLVSDHEWLIRDSNIYSGIKFYNLKEGNKYLILISGNMEEEVLNLLQFDYFIPKS